MHWLYLCRFPKALIDKVFGCLLKIFNANCRYITMTPAKIRIFIPIFTIIIAYLECSTALAQSFQPISKSDIDIMDKAIQSNQIQVYLARNGDVDSRGRRCMLIASSGIKGKYKTKRSELTISGSKLRVYTPSSKQKIVQEPRPGYRNCMSDSDAHSESGSVIKKDGIPILFQYRLAKDFCYLEAVYTTCTRQCVASAKSGSTFHYITLDKDLAEEISKHSCE